MRTRASRGSPQDDAQTASRGRAGWTWLLIGLLGLSPWLLTRRASAEADQDDPLTGYDLPNRRTPTLMRPEQIEEDARNAQAPTARARTVDEEAQAREAEAEERTRRLLARTGTTTGPFGGVFMIHDDNYFAVGAAGTHRKLVKFQVSVRYELLTLGSERGYSLSFAYSQKSLWDLFDTTSSAQSAPFLENNYRPEVFFAFRPRKTDYATEAAVGVRHESNGLGFVKSDPEVDQLRASKSWNQAYVSLLATCPRPFAWWRLRFHLAATLRLWVPFGVSAGELRASEQTPSDAERLETKRNADDRMRRNLGYGSLSADMRFNSSWLYRSRRIDDANVGLFRVTGRQRSVELSLYAPIYSFGFFRGSIYLQLFHGLAERLMMYDRKSTSFYVGMGLL